MALDFGPSWFGANLKTDVTPPKPMVTGNCVGLHQLDRQPDIWILAVVAAM
jgi:hypothetical protein